MANGQIHRDGKKPVQHTQRRDQKTDNCGRPKRDLGEGGDTRDRKREKVKNSIFRCPCDSRRTHEFHGCLAETHPLKQPPKELVLFADGTLKYASNLSCNQAEVGRTRGDVDRRKQVLELIEQARRPLFCRVNFCIVGPDCLYDIVPLLQFRQ
jgi:hypothetical protein